MTAPLREVRLLGTGTYAWRLLDVLARSGATVVGPHERQDMVDGGSSVHALVSVDTGGEGEGDGKPDG